MPQDQNDAVKDKCGDKRRQPNIRSVTSLSHFLSPLLYSVFVFQTGLVPFSVPTSNRIRQKHSSARPHRQRTVALCQGKRIG